MDAKQISQRTISITFEILSIKIGNDLKLSFFNIDFNFGFLPEITFFKENNIKIKKVCTSINASNTY